MAVTTTSIPLICFGRHRDLGQKMEKTLQPHFNYAAILTDYENPAAVLALLENLNPSPRGVIIGGGFDGEMVRQVKAVVEAWTKGREDADQIPVMSVPPGTFEAGGPPALVKWIKDELARVFTVEW
ncbi:hypothetical protein MMC34_004351 [Xylographa carneopallida]|nr:hypothetical protein [Xylographa carneopallida]